MVIEEVLDGDVERLQAHRGVRHESLAGSASICLAAAARIPGSVVEAVTAGRRPGELLIGHPSGVTPAKVETRSGPGGVTFDVLGFSRTARRLMGGTAYYPPLDQGNASCLPRCGASVPRSKTCWRACHTVEVSGMGGTHG